MLSDAIAIGNLNLRAISALRGLPQTMEWTAVSPTGQTLDLQEEQAWAMGCGVGELRIPDEPAVAAQVAEVDSEARLIDFFAVLSRLYGVPITSTRANLLGQPGVVHYVASIDGQPIGCCSGIRDGDVVGIENLAVVGFRERGVGAWLAYMALNGVLDEGCQRFGAPASNLGRSVCERLGALAEGDVYLMRME